MLPQGVRPTAHSNFSLAHQALTVNLQQNMTKAQAQLTQREEAIRKQAVDQATAAQQQNPAFIGSPMHQSLMRQQSQMLEQSHQVYISQVMEYQQKFQQQSQELLQGFQQQQQQQQQIGGAFGAMPASPGMGQAGISSPVARSMMPLSPLMPMSMGANGTMHPGMAGQAFAGVGRPTAPASPMGMMRFADGSGFGGPATPTRLSASGAVGQLGLSSPAHTGANTQAMLAMLLQQQRQQQPGTPKQTHLPLSPDMASQSAQQQMAAAQNQQMFELWTRATRVFLTHGNARIEKDLALQIATPNASMFMHLSLRDANHAMQVPESANSVLIRPVPGPFNGAGKVLLSLGVNSR
ncbi:hypothetical protein H4R19_007005, partial [Coemansia spiralis]